MRDASIVLGAVLGSMQLACGHPASKEECEEIFRRSAELKLREQEVNDEQEIQRLVDKARQDRGNNLVQPCIGRRITAKEMTCIRTADTLQELNACLE